MLLLQPSWLQCFYMIFLYLSEKQRKNDEIIANDVTIRNRSIVDFTPE